MCIMYDNDTALRKSVDGKGGVRHLQLQAPQLSCKVRQHSRQFVEGRVWRRNGWWWPHWCLRLCVHLNTWNSALSG